ncbi:unnamed protein product [Sympodiomycopsis kandeliae]
MPRRKKGKIYDRTLSYEFFHPVTGRDLTHLVNKGDLPPIEKVLISPPKEYRRVSGIVLMRKSRLAERSEQSIRDEEEGVRSSRKLSYELVLSGIDVGYIVADGAPPIEEVKNLGTDEYIKLYDKVSKRILRLKEAEEEGRLDEYIKEYNERKECKVVMPPTANKVAGKTKESPKARAKVDVYTKSIRQRDRALQNEKWKKANAEYFVTSRKLYAAHHLKAARYRATKRRQNLKKRSKGQYYEARKKAKKRARALAHASGGGEKTVAGGDGEE